MREQISAEYAFAILVQQSSRIAVSCVVSTAHFQALYPDHPAATHVRIPWIIGSIIGDVHPLTGSVGFHAAAIELNEI
jgi:uncharacterized membrane protein